MEEKRRESEQKDKRTENAPKEVRFFAKDGRPLNINQGKLEFNFTDDEENNVFSFDLACPKYLDTSLINIDLQTTYVRVTLKGKIMQLALPEEIKPDSSTAQRSQVTGHLLLTMPKLKGIVKPKIAKAKFNEEKKNKSHKSDACNEPTKLEVDPSAREEMDFGNIVREKTSKDLQEKLETTQLTRADAEQREDFVDDPDVPPLI